MLTRRLATVFAVAALVGSLAAPSALASQFRGRYQLRLDEAKSLVTAVAPTR